MKDRSRVINTTGSNVYLPLEMLISRNLKQASKDISRLERTEWQRWTPLFGIYRLIRDGNNHDGRLLSVAHSKYYNAAVGTYALLQIAAVVGSIKPIIEYFS